MTLLIAIEAIIVLIIFLYLVHLVSNIRNILRVFMFRMISDEIKDGEWQSSNKLNALQREGVITKHQQSVLSMMIRKKKKDA